MLHGLALAVLRLWAEIVKAEPALEFLAGVLPLPAPLAGGIGAGHVPQAAHQPPGLGKLMPYPGWHYRVAAGHGKPRQGVGQRPTMLRRLGEDFPALTAASRLRKPLANGFVGCGGGGPRRLAKGGEKCVKAGDWDARPGQVGRSCAFRRRQPVPRGHQIWVGVAQCPALVGQNLQRQPGVQLRVIHPPAFKLPVLVVLDQVVVGIAREGQRVEPQGVDGRQLQEPKAGLCGPQVGQVESDEVVA